MKKLLIAILILFSINASAQYTPMNAFGYQYKYLKADSGMALPFVDTSLRRNVDRPGLVVINPSDSIMYYYNGLKWKPMYVDSTGVIDLINKKVDSVTITGNNLFYWIGGTGYESQLNKLDSIHVSNDSIFTCIAGICDFKYLNANNDSVVTNVISSADSLIRYGLNWKGDTILIENWVGDGSGGGSGGITQSQLDDTASAIRSSFYIKSQIDAFLAGKENSLGNPSTNGYVLSSTTSGVRSWIAMGTYTLPTASSSVLGGIKVGADLNILSGVLSTRYTATNGGIQLGGSGYNLQLGGNLTTSNTITVSSGNYLRIVGGAASTDFGTNYTSFESPGAITSIFGSTITFTDKTTGYTTALYGQQGVATGNFNLYLPSNSNTLLTTVNGINGDLSGNVNIPSPTISSGSAAPSSTPAKVGDIYVDTSNKKLYFATGTSSSSDWTIAN